MAKTVVRRLAGFLAAFVFLLLAGGAAAHFVFDAKTRVVHVVAGGEGASVLIRFPLPLAYARALASRATPYDPVEAPFLKTEWREGVPFYRPDLDAIRREPEAFSAFLAEGYGFTVDGEPVPAVPLRFALRDNHGAATAGNGLDAIRAALSEPLTPAEEQAYVGDILADVEIGLPQATSNDAVLTVVSRLPAFAVPEGLVFDNLILDHRFGAPRMLRMEGLLLEPVTLAGSFLSEFLAFLKDGIGHILGGPDHILFVLCVVLASAGGRALVWSLTGFTLGHSLTLTLGSLGYAPSGAWFAPVIEMSVAASIVYAGGLALAGRPYRHGFALTAAIGLLHGYGFSFLLAKTLGGPVGGFVSALVAFNLGVEVGQLLVVAAAVVLLWSLAGIGSRASRYGRHGLALLSCLAALFWFGERAFALARSLG